MDTELLKLEQVGFAYGKQRVLEDVSFTLSSGEIVGLAGPNGAGKTTLLKIITGLLSASVGIVAINQSQNIGYLPQNIQRKDHYFPATVKEVVGMGLYGKVGILGRLTKEDKELVERSISDVGLGKLSEMQVNELSGGQLQRVYIARALVSKPQILILDEPTAAIDISGEEEFYKLVEKLNKRYGIAMILVSHDIYALLEHTKRLIFLNKKILYDGNPAKLNRNKLLHLIFYHKHSNKRISFLERRRARKPIRE